MREDTVPHEGQEAVGDVVRRVRMISSATSTPSTWTLERSGKMIIRCLLVLEKVGKSEKMFNLLLYHRADQQGCVTINVWPLCATRLAAVIKWRQSSLLAAPPDFASGRGYGEC